MSWDAGWRLYRWLRKPSKETEKEEEKEEISVKEIRLRKKIEQLLELQKQIDQDYLRAKAYIDKNLDKVKNPYVKEIIKQILVEAEERAEYSNPKYWHTHKIPIIVAADALMKGLDKDEIEFLGYLIGKSYAISKTLMEEVSEGVTWEDLENIYDEEFPMKAREDFSYIHPSNILAHIRSAISRAMSKLKMLEKDPDHPITLLGFLYEFEDATDGLEWFTPSERRREEKRIEEYISEIENEEEERMRRLGKLIRQHASSPVLEPVEKPPATAAGGAIFAHPDRYPTLTQKILLKTLILEKHLKEGNGVHRDLYRALRNLLTSPLITSNWHPWLADWLERLEKGEKVSPLRDILERIENTAGGNLSRTLEEAYSYLKKIEDGAEIRDIPAGERRRFLDAIEKIKSFIWNNPDIADRLVKEMSYLSGINQNHARKAIVGIIDDYAKVYAGEKDPRQLDLERDALQVIHTITSLTHEGSYVSQRKLVEELRQIIESHIQDPLLKKAYLEAINHYRETRYDIPKDKRFLGALLEREGELEEKLKQLEHENRKLSGTEVRRIANLYRYLMLLTPHPTLEETRQFYKRLADSLKIRVGTEEFLPIHGPVTTDTMDSFSRIRRARPGELQEVIKTEISDFEPLFYAAPHIKERVFNMLQMEHTGGERIIPKEKHEEFVDYLKRLQVRKVGLGVAVVSFVAHRAHFLL